VSSVNVLGGWRLRQISLVGAGRNGNVLKPNVFRPVSRADRARTSLGQQPIVDNQCDFKMILRERFRSIDNARAPIKPSAVQRSTPHATFRFRMLLQRVRWEGIDHKTQNFHQPMPNLHLNPSNQIVQPTLHNESTSYLQ